MACWGGALCSLKNKASRHVHREREKQLVPVIEPKWNPDNLIREKRGRTKKQQKKSVCLCISIEFWPFVLMLYAYQRPAIKSKSGTKIKWKTSSQERNCRDAEGTTWKMREWEQKKGAGSKWGTNLQSLLVILFQNRPSSTASHTLVFFTILTFTGV